MYLVWGPLFGALLYDIPIKDGFVKFGGVGFTCNSHTFVVKYRFLGCLGNWIIRLIIVCERSFVNKVCFVARFAGNFGTFQRYK